MKIHVAMASIGNVYCVEIYSNIILQVCMYIYNLTLSYMHSQNDDTQKTTNQQQQKNRQNHLLTTHKIEHKQETQHDCRFIHVEPFKGSQLSAKFSRLFVINSYGCSLRQLDRQILKSRSSFRSISCANKSKEEALSGHSCVN